jgi:hypothetical protein
MVFEKLYNVMAAIFINIISMIIPCWKIFPSLHIRFKRINRLSRLAIIIVPTQNPNWFHFRKVFELHVG